jgi:hypothetical protein
MVLRNQEVETRNHVVEKTPMMVVGDIGQTLEESNMGPKGGGKKLDTGGE